MGKFNIHSHVDFLLNDTIIKIIIIITAIIFCLLWYAMVKQSWYVGLYDYPFIWNGVDGYGGCDECASVYIYMRYMCTPDLFCSIFCFIWKCRKITIKKYVKRKSLDNAIKFYRWKFWHICACDAIFKMVRLVWLSNGYAIILNICVTKCDALHARAHYRINKNGWFFLEWFDITFG